MKNLDQEIEKINEFLYNDEKAENLIKESLNKGFVFKNKAIIVEEISELIQSITKIIRERENKLNTLEEISDFYIASLYISNIWNINLSYKKKDKEYSLIKIIYILSSLQTFLLKKINYNFYFFDKYILKYKLVKAFRAVDYLKYYIDADEEIISKIKEAKYRGLKKVLKGDCKW